MKITSLKEQLKNPERVNVFVDQKYSFSLSIGEVIDHKVRVNTEVSSIDVEKLKKISSDGKVRARTYEWLLNRPHSTRELRDYLRRKKVEPELIEKLTQEFSNKNVVSDDRFKEWFVERAVRKHKSARLIQNELRGKGIKSSTTPHDSIDDLASLKQLIEKLVSRPRYADQSRLIRYLQGKGFSYGDIKTALMLQEPEREP